MNVLTRKQKINQILRHFLNNDDYEFVNTQFVPNKNGSGGNIELEGIDNYSFKTFFDYTYIDNNDASAIIEQIEESLLEEN